MHMPAQDVLVALAANLALLALALIAFIQIKALFWTLPDRFEPLFNGFAFGCAAALAMTLPMSIAPGILVDGRTVPIGLAALFGGPVATVIAAVLAIVYRFILGGVGDVAGAIGIALAACGGLIVSSLVRRTNAWMTSAHLLLLGVLLVFSCLISTLSLPGPELAYSVITAAIVPEAIALPLGTLFLGNLLLQEQRRRSMEVAGAESRRRFQTITDNVPGVVYQCLLTQSGEIRYPYFSARVQDLFGVTAEEAMADASNILNAVHVDDFDRLSRSIKESAAHLSVWTHEYRVVHKDGQIKWLNAKAVPHRRNDGDVIWDGIVTDETERKTAEMALSAANGLLTTTNERLSNLYEAAQQFVDNVAHEFRTPLTVIKEFAAIMEEGLVGELNAEQQDYLHTICARVDDLNGLVNDMLDLSRLEAGLVGAARRRCTIQDIVGRVQSTLERRASASNVAFSVELEDGLPDLYCDPEKIGRVVINLAVNAFKYGGEKGGVQLRVRRSSVAAEVLVDVTDHGPGIPAEKLETIFERFSQAGGLRDTAKGFGLGLSIVRELVGLNFGAVSVKSELGEGSTFSFSVPTFDPQAIVARYVARLAKHRPPLFLVSDIRISASGPLDPAFSDECDAFLQHQARQDELLLRLGPEFWILLTADKRDSEVRSKAKALRDEFAEHSAVVTDGTRGIDVQPLGVWRLPSQEPALIARITTLRDMASARLSA
jgi:PAS domain S-box-containing protein